MGQNKANLHSTMVLLKFELLINNHNSQVYLHSTMVLLKSFSNSRIRVSEVASTFHYGSIKIKTDVLNMIYQYASTFHYGSIKIRC